MLIISMPNKLVSITTFITSLPIISMYINMLISMLTIIMNNSLLSVSMVIIDMFIIRMLVNMHMNHMLIFRMHTRMRSSACSSSA